MLEQILITFQILIIDVVMAADNAIIIGIIAANFAPDNRKKIIALGVAGAFIFRIFLVPFCHLVRCLLFLDSIQTTL